MCKNLLFNKDSLNWWSSKDPVCNPTSTEPENGWTAKSFLKTIITISTGLSVNSKLENHVQIINNQDILSHGQNNTKFYFTLTTATEIVTSFNLFSALAIYQKNIFTQHKTKNGQPLFTISHVQSIQFIQKAMHKTSRNENNNLLFIKHIHFATSQTSVSTAEPKKTNHYWAN